MGFNIGGLLKSVINPMTLAQLAMGPAGWASIAMKAVASAVIQQVIQQVGQKLGLPQPMIELAQTAAGQAMGVPFEKGSSLKSVIDNVSDLAEQAGMGPLSLTEKATLEKIGTSEQRRLSDSLLETEEFRNARSGGAAKGSIFMQIAVALGKLADKKMGEMASLANQIGGIKDGKQANEVTKLTGEMQAKGQEFGLISNAMSNSIKTIGDGITQLARKG